MKTDNLTRTVRVIKDFCFLRSYYFLLLVVFNLTFLQSNKLKAQITFEMTFGNSGQEVCHKAIYSNGKIYLTGHTTSIGSGSYDISFIRTDGQGNLLSNTIAGLQGEDIPLSATSNSANEFILCGYTNSLGSEKPFVIKFDSAGNSVWSKYFSFPGWAEDIVSLPNGDFYFTGYISNTDLDVIIIKCNSLGHVIWAKSIGDTLINEGRKITLSEDDGVIVTGMTQIQAGGPTDICVIKADKNGKVLWSKKYATPDFYNWDNGYAVRSAGNEILIGCLSYNQAFNSNPNSPDGLILRLDKYGVLINAKAFGSHEYEDIRDLEILSDGNFCFTGATNFNSNGQTDLLFAISDSSGNILTQKFFGGNSYDHGLSIQSINENDFLIGGYSESLGNGSSDMYIIRTDTSAFYSCNAITGSLASVSVIVNEETVFDTASLNVSAQNINFIITHQNISQNILCTTTGEDENASENSSSFFPNPFDDVTQLPVILFPENKTEMFSSSGVLVNKEGLYEFTKNGLQVNGKELASGLYFIKIQLEDKFIIKKIIKR